jgi:hypothetical protein
MEVQVRVRDKDSLAETLGWFSMGLGAAQIAAPRAICRLVGASTEGFAPRVMRLMGVREITQGTGILARPWRRRCSASRPPASSGTRT